MFRAPFLLCQEEELIFSYHAYAAQPTRGSECVKLFLSIGSIDPFLSDCYLKEGERERKVEREDRGHSFVLQFSSRLEMLFGEGKRARSKLAYFSPTLQYGRRPCPHFCFPRERREVGISITFSYVTIWEETVASFLFAGRLKGRLICIYALYRIYANEVGERKELVFYPFSLSNSFFSFVRKASLYMLLFLPTMTHTELLLSDIDNYVVDWFFPPIITTYYFASGSKCNNRFLAYLNSIT